MRKDLLRHLPGRKRFVVAGIVMACTVVAAFVVDASRPQVQPRDAVAGGQPGTVPCFASRAAALHAGDLKQASGYAFTKFLDLPTRHYPSRGRPFGPVPLIERDFRFGRMTGFLINISLTGKYRRENNALVRSLKGKPQKWPSVPLEGSILRDHPGAVEVYETAFVWNSPASAREELARHPRHDTKSTKVFRVSIGDESAGSLWLSPNVALQSTMGASARFGSQVIQVSFGGGRGMKPASALALLHRAVERIHAACSAKL